MPAEFVAPAATYLLPASDGDSSGPGVLIWDGAPTRSTSLYRIAYPGAVDACDIKEYPTRFLGIGGGAAVLGLHPDTNRASITDALSARLLDVILVEGLAASAAEHVSAFVPMAAAGGTGAALIANGESRVLTLLEARPAPRLLLDPPLQISLEPIPAVAAGERRLRVAADRELGFVLVGARGSRDLAVFRRVKGGIAYAEQVALDEPLRDLTAIGGPPPFAPDIFVFLADDGRSLLASSIAALRDRLVPRSAPSPPVPAPTALRAGAVAALDPSEAARLQRILTSFGYQVGAIDGMIGARTLSALRAFQCDSGVATSGDLDEATLEALAAALAGGGASGSAEAIRRYAAFLGERVAGVEARRLLTLGGAQGDRGHPCFGLNKIAPEALWPNSIRFANVLRRLETDLGLRIRVISGLRTAAYDRCVGDGAEPEHGDFVAFDVSPADEAAAADLAAALERLQDAGLVTVDLRRSDGWLHVAPRIGERHAVIASHAPNEKGCAFAREDAAEFARLLAGTEAVGRELSVIWAPRPERFVVTLDTHGDGDGARRASALIRKLADRSADGRTGADSSVRRNDGWLIDSTCAEAYIVASLP